MSEDMWHVQMEPGDVKVVTLEQMDDMFRLELIEGSTLVWQEGMPRALPLSVVAGIDEGEEEEEEIMEIEPEPLDSAPILNVAPVPSYSAPPPPPPSVPAKASAPAPAYSTITPPPASAAAVSQVPTAPPAPALPSPDFYSPQSLRPITMSGAPHAPTGTGTGGRVVMALAVAAGLILTLYRNDILSDAAKSAGSEGVYSKVESAFGQPGFGTTRSVQQLAALIPHDEALTTLPAAAAAPASTTATSDTESTSEANVPEKVTLDDAEDKASSGATSPAKAAGNAATHSKARKPLRKAGAPKKSLKKFKGSEYDPMNASL